jgi:hypothetical protein
VPRRKARREIPESDFVPVGRFEGSISGASELESEDMEEVRWEGVNDGCHSSSGRWERRSVGQEMFGSPGWAEVEEVILRL